MKRILHLILISCLCLSAAAQKNAPKWMNKAKRAVFTITTYGKDGNKLATSTGFFISETGEAVSTISLRVPRKQQSQTLREKHFWLRISWVQTNCMTL